MCRRCGDPECTGGDSGHIGINGRVYPEIRARTFGLSPALRDGGGALAVSLVDVGDPGASELFAITVGLTCEALASIRDQIDKILGGDPPGPPPKIEPMRPTFPFRAGRDN